jgi:hypothetical protein
MIPNESPIEKNQFYCIESKKLVVYLKLPMSNKSECLSDNNQLSNFIKFSSLIPISTDLNQLKLNLSFFDCNLSNASNKLWTYSFLCFFVIVIIMVLCARMKKKFSSLKQKKIISFYLTVFVEKSYQMKIKEIVTEYCNILKV